MIKKTLLGVTFLAVALVAVASVMYVGNATPTVPAVSRADAANPNRPYVVKLHAQWCPICMLFFDDNAGVTGTIAVLDGRTRAETASIHGIKGFDEYQAAIEASLRAVTR